MFMNSPTVVYSLFSLISFSLVISFSVVEVYAQYRLTLLINCLDQQLPCQSIQLVCYQYCSHHYQACYLIASNNLHSTRFFLILNPKNSRPGKTRSREYRSSKSRNHSDWINVKQPGSHFRLCTQTKHIFFVNQNQIAPVISVSIRSL